MSTSFLISSVGSIIKLTIDDVHLFFSSITMVTIVVGSKVEAIQEVGILIFGDAVHWIGVKELTVAHGLVHGLKLRGIGRHKPKLIDGLIVCR